MFLPRDHASEAAKKIKVRNDCSAVRRSKSTRDLPGARISTYSVIEDPVSTCRARFCGGNLARSCYAPIERVAPGARLPVRDADPSLRLFHGGPL